MKLSQFKYKLPQELIALYPSANRDESRLMVVDREKGKIEHKVFHELIEYFKEDDLLVFNNLEVKVREDAPAEGSDQVTFTLGVTDIIFNPVYAVYDRVLLRPDGPVVSPAYWRQQEGDTTGEYWDFGKTAEADPYE